MTCPENQSPLMARGVVGVPKFSKEVQDKFWANEEENAYVQLEVMGDPPPKAQWFKGDTPLMENERLKFWTDGKKALVILGVEDCNKEDEGIYKCVITNRFGKREHKFKLFIAGANTVESWLVHRKAPPKREVPLYWTDTPRTKSIKLGAESVCFTAKLTVDNKKVNWFFEDQECNDDNKYEFVQENGSYTIKINNPSLDDTGHYKCVLVENDDLSCQTHLDVQVPDPEYRITSTVPSQLKCFTNRPMQLTCSTSLGANVEWIKNGQEKISNGRAVLTNKDGVHSLHIHEAKISDTGTYTCRIVKYGVEGEMQTSCHVDISDFPHKFVQKLAEINETEKSTIKMEVTTAEDDAIVNWFKNGEQVVIERKRKQRLHIMSKHQVHCLIIENCTVRDAGVYTAKTNAEETSCKVNISEFAHMFTTPLPNTLSIIEEDRATFEVITEHEDAEVKWFHNNVQFIAEKSRIARIQMQSLGNKHTLSIKKCTPQDTAKIEARTNKDSTVCNLMVKCYNSFEKRLIDLSECSERERMEFSVSVRDIFAPVTFYIDKVPVDVSDGRIEVINNENGEHILVINKVLLLDAGLISCKTPSNRGGELLECKGIFNVIQGESEPFIETVEPVSCVAILHSYRERTNAYIHKEQCRIVIPYRIEGERQSNLQIFVEKDGIEKEIGNEIKMKVTKDKVMIDVINPQRDMSGLYKVTLKNAVGSAQVSVPVEVMDHPSPPRDVTISNIFKDNVTVNWKPPSDDGGTPIKRYVIDVLDFTTNNMWTPVTMSETGQDNKAMVLNLLPGHRYCFRVSCANRVGVSDPTDMKEAEILTKDPWDIPSSCGKAEVIDWTPSFADITWTPPEKNGGADITSYIIEYKETNMRNWLEGVEIPVEEVDIWEDGLRGRCENLEEEYEYRFRVIAVNKGGKSDPGLPSSSIIAMHRQISPYIKSGGLTDVNIKEGQGIRFDIWFGGEPAPVAEWVKDGYPLMNEDGTVAIDTYSKNSVYTLKNIVLSIPNALEEQHAGVYKLRLKNECGVFESSANIKIEGPPGKKKLWQIKQKEEEEEEAILEENKMEMIINRKLSDIKHDGKDDDKDSGLKIGEESCNGTEEDYEWTDNSYDEDYDEDFYEGDGSDEQNMEDDSTNVHANNNSCENTINKDSADNIYSESSRNNLELRENNKSASDGKSHTSLPMKYSQEDEEQFENQLNLKNDNMSQNNYGNYSQQYDQKENQEFLSQNSREQKQEDRQATKNVYTLEKGDENTKLQTMSSGSSYDDEYDEDFYEGEDSDEQNVEDETANFHKNKHITYEISDPNPVNKVLIDNVNKEESRKNQEQENTNKTSSYGESQSAIPVNHSRQDQEQLENQFNLKNDNSSYNHMDHPHQQYIEENTEFVSQNQEASHQKGNEDTQASEWNSTYTNMVSINSDGSYDSENGKDVYEGESPEGQNVQDDATNFYKIENIENQSNYQTTIQKDYMYNFDTEESRNDMESKDVNKTGTNGEFYNSIPIKNKKQDEEQYNSNNDNISHNYLDCMHQNDIRDTQESINQIDLKHNQEDNHHVNGYDKQCKQNISLGETSNDLSTDEISKTQKSGWLDSSIDELHNTNKTGSHVKTLNDVSRYIEQEKKEKEEADRKAKEEEMRYIERQKREKEEAERKAKEDEKRNRENALQTKISSLGFSKAEVEDVSLSSSGDGGLVALLDQMKQENQDFKVWDRDDYSFLRWYICKQMETSISKGANPKFIQGLDIDPMDYVKKIENDGEYIDNTFLQATANIFNKDIVVISTDTDTILKGGSEGNRGKGSPLYLAHLKDSNTHKDHYSSIVPNENKDIEIINKIDDNFVEPTPNNMVEINDVDDSIKSNVLEKSNIEKKITITITVRN